MKKPLNTFAIVNELAEGSAFFPNYKGNNSPTSQTPEQENLAEEITRTPSTTSTPVPPVRVVRDVPPVPQKLPKKRIMKQRHPFDIWQDQYASLQEISLAERKLGGVGSMSATAREGLDLIIAKRKKELNLE